MHLIQSPRPTDGSADSSHCCIPSRPTATAGCFVLLSSSWLVCRSSPFLSLQQSWLVPGPCSTMAGRMAGSVTIIRPSRWAISQAVGWSLHRSWLTICFSPITFFRGREIVIKRVFSKNLRNSSSCVGVNTLLLVLIINPRISTHYNEIGSGGLCCTVQYRKSFIGTYVQSLSEYFSHILGFTTICTGLHRVGILIYISG